MPGNSSDYSSRSSSTSQPRASRYSRGLMGFSALLGKSLHSFAPRFPVSGARSRRERRLADPEHFLHSLAQVLRGKQSETQSWRVEITLDQDERPFPYIEDLGELRGGDPTLFSKLPKAVANGGLSGPARGEFLTASAGKEIAPGLAPLSLFESEKPVCGSHGRHEDRQRTGRREGEQNNGVGGREDHEGLRDRCGLHGMDEGQAPKKDCEKQGRCSQASPPSQDGGGISVGHWMLLYGRCVYLHRQMPEAPPGFLEVRCCGRTWPCGRALWRDPLGSLGESHRRGRREWRDNKPRRAGGSWDPTPGPAALPDAR